MNRKILYIINPISGTRKKAGLQQLIKEKTEEASIPYQIEPSTADGNYDHLSERILEQQFTDVVIAGGDGTVSQVIGSLKHTQVQFGIIPCGSGNGLALAAGIPINAEKALQLIFEGTSRSTDGFRINDHFACMLCGLGFDAQVAHDFARQKKRGFFTYLKKTILNFLKGKTYLFHLKTGGIELETRAYFISIANSNQFGNHLTIAPKASLTDGLLDIIIVTEQTRLGFAFNILKQILGFNKLVKNLTALNRKKVWYFQTNELTIINREHAPFHLDGDPAPPTEQLNVQIEKHCFRLIGNFT